MLWLEHVRADVFHLCRRWRTRWWLLRQPTGVFLPEQRTGGSGGPRERLHPARDDGRFPVLLADCSSRGKSQKRRGACRKELFRMPFCFKVSAMEPPVRAEPVAQDDKTKLLKAAFLQFCRCVFKPLPNTFTSRIQHAFKNNPFFIPPPCSEMSQ